MMLIKQENVKKKRNILLKNDLKKYNTPFLHDQQIEL